MENFQPLGVPGTIILPLRAREGGWFGPEESPTVEEIWPDPYLQSAVKECPEPGFEAGQRGSGQGYVPQGRQPLAGPELCVSRQKSGILEPVEPQGLPPSTHLQVDSGACVRRMSSARCWSPGKPNEPI